MREHARREGNREQRDEALAGFFRDDEEFDDEEERTIELLLTTSSGAEVDVELDPEELAEDAEAIAEIFGSASIANLNISEKEDIFNDLLQVKKSFIEQKSTFAGVTEPPKAPAIAFSNA